MARTRFDNLDDEKQERIIEAAGEEFAEKGYEGASINQIIKRAGISKGSLYYYFEDKEDVFTTVLTYVSEKVLKETSGITFDHLTAETYWPMMEAMGEKGAEYVKERPWYMRFARVFYEVYQPGETEGPGVKAMDWSRKITTDLIARGQELGVVRDDMPTDYLAAMMMGLGDGANRWLMERLDDLSELDLKAHQQRQFKLMRRLLSP
ncbi:MAG: TetR/AcrR family transcriptional regulator [Bradymonadaceae bacterium]